MADTGPRRRNVLLAAGSILAAALALDTAVWAWACQRLDDGAREAVAAAGWAIEGRPAAWGGWPVAAEITLPDAILRSGPTVVPPLTWAVARLQLRLPAWSPTRLVVAASGGQSLAFGTGRPTPFTAALAANIDLNQGEPPHLAATEIVVDAPLGPVRARTMTLLLPPGGWSAVLGGVTFPGHDGRPITPPIDSVQVDGRLDPPIEPMQTARQSAQAWRDHGGRLALVIAGLRWGALAASARLTLTLDPALQPIVAGTVTASGLPATLGQLAENGAITSATSTAAQAMLVILAAPTGTGAITVPVAAQDGVVSVARFPLLRLAPLQWE